MLSLRVCRELARRCKSMDVIATEVPTDALHIGSFINWNICFYIRMFHPINAR